jgi:hypothetical protein
MTTFSFSSPSFARALLRERGGGDHAPVKADLAQVERHRGREDIRRDDENATGGQSQRRRDGGGDGVRARGLLLADGPRVDFRKRRLRLLLHQFAQRLLQTN